MVAPNIRRIDSLGWGEIFMLNSFPVALIIGTLLSFLAGLGVGGGSLLMIWLTVLLSVEYSIARTVNLLVFIPTAICASFFRWKQGALQIGQVLPAIIAGCIAAGVFSFLGKTMDIELLKKLFGILLLITGVRELTYRPRSR